MRSLRYLNTVLTLIAVLLTLTLWTLWTASPLPDPTAAPAQAQGILEAGLQRRDMINRLDMLNGKLDALIDLLRSGEARVRVESGDKAESQPVTFTPTPRSDVRPAEASAQ